MAENLRNEVPRRRADRDFHAERVRSRRLWKNLLFIIFLLGGAGAALALLTILGR